MRKKLISLMIALTLFCGLFAFDGLDSYADVYNATWVLDDGQNTPLQTGVVYPAGTALKVINGGYGINLAYLDGNIEIGFFGPNTVSKDFVYIRQEQQDGGNFVYLYLESYVSFEPYNIKIEESLENYPKDVLATAYVNEGDSLSNAMMKALYNNPNLSLEFKFTYEGVEHVVFIPAGQAVNDDIEWYGPLWLLKKYGEKDEVRTYTIQPGDTLSKIAKKLGTTVKELKKKNNIKNKDKIRAGKELVY